MREVVAILRGVTPNEVVAISEGLLETGIQQVEVPLNSPQAVESIALISEAFGADALIGAGTVLTTEQVDAVADAGGKLIISPNCNPAVIKRSKELGLTSLPGVLTPTECFAALESGADGLKFFPAFKLGLDGFNAFSAVLPNDVKTYAVGGVGAEDFADWLAAGITGFGIGSALYKPGDTVEVVRRKAETMVAAWDGAVAE
uniref:2-dehydro-3-deoxyphosphogalactonate aldolase (EC) n=1 Tax=uncultured Thiotrichaceae bacterium TaxID=298394 RepID=A0A6S6U4Z5_9GAMM|nr:MAG: 2-dehydro-3-deoxyphosphogalactonate aldolase (EC [uncultured Thiotrichaceae bacterium]